MIYETQPVCSLSQAAGSWQHARGMSDALSLPRSQMIFAIVAFSTVVDYDGLSRIQFVMFTGITGFILALFFMIAYAAGIGAVSTPGRAFGCLEAPSFAVQTRLAAHKSRLPHLLGTRGAAPAAAADVAAASWPRRGAPLCPICFCPRPPFAVPRHCRLCSGCHLGCLLDCCRRLRVVCAQ